MYFLFSFTVIIPVDLMLKVFFIKTEGLLHHCCTSKSNTDR